LNDNINNEQPEEKKPEKRVIKKNVKPNINKKGRSVRDVLGLSRDYLKNRKSKYSINQIPIERQMIDNIVEVSELLRDTVNNGNDMLKTYNELNYDLFLSLYNGYPEMVGKEEMRDNYILNHGLIDEISESSDFNKLKQYCTLDQLSSALASISMHENMQEKIQEIKEQYEDSEEKSIIDKINEQTENDDLIEKLLNANDQISELQDEFGSNEKLDKAKDAVRMKLEEALEKAKQQEEEMLENFDEVEQVKNDIKTAAKEAAKVALVEVAEVSDTIAAWGFNPGEKTRVSLDSKIAAFKKIKESKKLMKFTDLIGKLKEMAKQEQKVKSVNGVSDIKGINTGNRIQHILPSERMLLNNPTAKKDFYKRYFERSLLQYELNSFDKKGRGPIIVCVDISGSMHGDREIFSKAFAVALIDIAQIQHRNYAYISFDTRVCEFMVIEKGTLNPEAIVDICEEGTRGGTNFQPPLEKALELLKDSRFKKGDIVFVTDGECSLSDDFIKKFNKIKEEKEFACRGILIDLDRYSSQRTLDLFCTDVVRISNLTEMQADSAVAKQIFHDL
jgi:uncharacterized protein with von Willebrand factor type A (vWA) domain